MSKKQASTKKKSQSHSNSRSRSRSRDPPKEKPKGKEKATEATEGKGKGKEKASKSTDETDKGKEKKKPSRVKKCVTCKHLNPHNNCYYCELLLCHDPDCLFTHMKHCEKRPDDYNEETEREHLAESGPLIINGTERLLECVEKAILDDGKLIATIQQRLLDHKKMLGVLEGMKKQVELIRTEMEEL